MSDDFPSVLRTHATSVESEGWYTVANALERAATEIESLRARLSQAGAGGGVVVKPLEWSEPAKLNNGCWTADCILGTYSVAFDDGWYACLEDGARWEWEPEHDPRSYEGPYAAQAACQAHLEARIRSALLPPSTEAQAGSPAEALPSQTSGAEATQQLLDKALRVLGRCHTVLFNMAKENEGAVFNRWPIHHEPLRSDARNLLPLIDEVLGHD